MSSAVNIYDAKTHLSALIDRAARGEEIVIARAGKPVARLVPIATTSPARRPGGWEDDLWIADDFDAPLPADVLASFTGEPKRRSEFAHRKGQPRRKAGT